VDPRCDIFSVGVVLYEMLSGRRPFTGPNITAIINQITRATPEALAIIDPGLSAAVQMVVDRCLEKHPARRYQTAVELRADLKSAAFITALAGKTRVKTRSASTPDKTECHDLSAETIPETVPRRSADDRQ
jgi:serine/threonine protein kinase